MWKPVHPAGMVAVAGFFIDAHEVTFADYAAFVSALSSKSPPALPARCAFKKDFKPSACTDVSALTSQHPAACVDWCDAFAYCAFNGKRLCGKTGGGPVDPVLPLEDQWTAACGGSAGHMYPYGDGMSPNASACATLIGNAGTNPSTVASHPSCVGSVPGLFDMSGNVWEWEDQCSSSPMDGGKDICTVRGGSVANPLDQATCFVAQRYALDFRYYNTGIRDCADP